MKILLRRSKDQFTPLRRIPNQLLALFLSPSLLTRLCLLALLCLATVAAYSNSFHVPFVFDDEPIILHNKQLHITDLNQLTIPWFFSLVQRSRPLARLSFALNYCEGGADVAGFHYTNLVIHLFVVLIVYLLVFQLARLSGQKNWSFSIAFFSCSFFALHPVNTQAVTYIVQRETALAAFFFCVSIFAYVQVRQGIFPRLYSLVCLFAGGAAVACKQNTAVLPLVLFWADLCFFPELTSQRKKRIYWLLVAGLLLPVCLLLFSSGSNPVHWILQQYEQQRAFSLGERLLTEARVILHYLGLLVFPAPYRLNLDYDFPLSVGFLQPFSTGVAFLFLTGVALLAVQLRKLRPLLAFFLGWFCLTLVVESTVLPLELVFEHRLYLPSVGGVVLVCYFIITMMNVYWQRTHGLIGYLPLLLCLLLGWGTYARNKVWQSGKLLWSDCLEKSPNKARPYDNLGNVYLAEGNYQQAIALHKKSLQLNPKRSDSYFNLANDFLRSGDPRQAIPLFKQSLLLEADNVESLSNLADAYLKTGLFEQAIAAQQQAVRLDPGEAKGFYSLGYIQLLSGDYHAAQVAFEQAITLKVDYVQAYNNLGAVFLLLEQYQAAITVYKKLLLLQPDQPAFLNNIGVAYQKMGNLKAAVFWWEQAVHYKEDYYQVWNLLAGVAINLKDVKRAQFCLQFSLKVAPNQPTADRITAQLHLLNP